MPAMCVRVTSSRGRDRQAKLRTRGLHFISVQSGPEADGPDGFWLLKDVEAAARSS